MPPSHWPPLRFHGTYGRLPLYDVATGRYIFNVPDPSDHGHWMKKGGGMAGSVEAETSAGGRHGAGGHLTVTAEKGAGGRSTYHLQHTDASGKMVYEGHGLTLARVNQYAGKGEKVTGAHFQSAEERAQAMQARANAKARSVGIKEANGTAKGTGGEAGRITRGADGASSGARGASKSEGSKSEGSKSEPLKSSAGKLTAEDVTRSKADWTTPTKDSATKTTYASPEQQRAVLGVARAIHSQPSEIGVIVTRDGRLGARNVAGDDRRVEVTQQMRDQMPGNDLIHNHPLGVGSKRAGELTDASFSSADIKTAMTYHAGGIHAVTEDRKGGATLFTMRPAAGHTWTAKDWQTIQQSLATHMTKEEVVRGMAESLMSARGTPKAVRVEMMRNTMHSVWKAVAAEHADIMRYSWHAMTPTELAGGGVKGFLKGRVAAVGARINQKQ